MINLETYNNRILKYSTALPEKNFTSQRAEASNSNPSFKSPPKSNNYGGVMLGATIAAGIAIASIVIMNGRGAKSASSKINNSLINIKEEVAESSLDILKELEQKRINTEKSIRTKILTWYKKTINLNPMDPEYKKLNDRITKVTVPEHKNSFKFSNEIFSNEEASNVVSFLKKYQYNGFLREGKINPEEVSEIKILDDIIKKSKPLQEETTVYRGIRTKELFGDFNVLGFAKEIKEGAVLEDKSFAAATRVYSDELAQVDPVWLDEVKNAGYVVRIKLLKGTQGIDCRAFSGMESSKGVNSVFVLPRGTKIKITAINEDDKIIDAVNVLDK